MSPAAYRKKKKDLFYSSLEAGYNNEKLVGDA